MQISYTKLFSKTVKYLNIDGYVYWFLNKSNFLFYCFFHKVGDELNGFLVYCSQSAAQLEEAAKEEYNVCILCKLPSIRFT